VTSFIDDKSESNLVGVYVDLQDMRALLDHVWIELIVPRAKQRVGDVETFAIARELDHLWSSNESVDDVTHMSMTKRSTTSSHLFITACP